MKLRRKYFFITTALLFLPWNHLAPAIKNGRVEEEAIRYKGDHFLLLADYFSNQVFRRGWRLKQILDG